MNGPKRDGKKPTRKNGGSPRVVHFIRDSEYKISGIKKLANKYARLDSFLVCPEIYYSVQLRLLHSLLVQTLEICTSLYSIGPKLY